MPTRRYNAIFTAVLVTGTLVATSACGRKDVVASMPPTQVAAIKQQPSNEEALLAANPPGAGASAPVSAPAELTAEGLAKGIPASGVLRADPLAAAYR